MCELARRQNNDEVDVYAQAMSRAGMPCMPIRRMLRHRAKHGGRSRDIDGRGAAGDAGMAHMVVTIFYGLGRLFEVYYNEWFKMN